MRDELLLIPGPTTLSSRVRQALAQPQAGHVSPEYREAFRELLDLTKYAFRAEKALPFVITGSGTVAMEAAVASLIEPGDRVLSLDTGVFGKRFTSILKIYGAAVDELCFDPGRPADVSEVEVRLSKGGYKAVFVTHVDTSTTVVNPVEEVVEAASKHGALSVIDSVCGAGGCKFNFDDMGADVALTASQKALAAPPGAGLIVLSRRALEVVEGRKTPIRSYYMDLLRWKKVMDNPSAYFATPSTTIMLALREALKAVREEGIENRWRRHRLIAEGIRAAIKALGLSFIAEEGHRADTVTGLYVPEGRSAEIQGFMREFFGVHVALGFGEFKDRALRIGHFGNITPSDALVLATALEASLRSLGMDVRPGAAAEAALPHLERLKG